MASIHKEIVIDAPAEHVWGAVRDVGAVHTRLARQFVTATRLDGDSRLVTFADGTVVRERILDVDDRTHRVAYAVIEGLPTHSHHHASMQILPDGGTRSRLVWITDVLPNDLAGFMDGMMEKGCAAMKQTLESKRAAANSTDGP